LVGPVDQHNAGPLPDFLYGLLEGIMQELDLIAERLYGKRARKT
jgi:hypothetical protein